MLTRLAEPSMTEQARHDFMLGFYDRWLTLLDIPVPSHCDHRGRLYRRGPHLRLRQRYLRCR